MSSNELPDFGEDYIQVFDPVEKSYQIRRKSRSEGALSITQAMELISVLLKSHQLTYVPHHTHKNLLFLPFAFIRPKEGDKIRNLTTNEVYTVDQVLLNPTTKNWDGLVRLDLQNPPKITEKHSLAYENNDRYISFVHEMPDRILNSASANTEGIIDQKIPMNPTVTWSLRVKEAGGYGKPFDTKKQRTPHLRESVKDPLVPGYTVEIYGQWFDNIVQFDSWSNDQRTAERLISWFEQFMTSYAGYIKQQGIPHLFFWRRNADDVNTTWRQSFAMRSSQYYFRTEELEAVYQRDILKIDVTLGANATFVNRRDLEPRFIADQYVSGQPTTEEYRNLFYRSGQFLFGDIDILHN